MDRISGVVVFTLATVILWQSRHLSIGSFRAPGPGFFPTLLAFVLIVLSLCLIIPRQKEEGRKETVSSRSLGRVTLVFLFLLTYFFFFNFLGFAVISFLLMASLFLVVAGKKWHASIFWAFISTGLAYLLFDVLLKSPLPKGVLGV
jgi:putative tricarboxylic transport membrane protein